MEQSKKGVIFDRVFFIIATVMSLLHIILYSLLTLLQSIFVRYPIIVVITYGHFIPVGSAEHIGFIILYVIVFIFSLCGLFAVLILSEEQKERFAPKDEDESEAGSSVESVYYQEDDNSSDKMLDNNYSTGRLCGIYFRYLLTPTICVSQMVMLNIVGLPFFA
jgi:hypothetical protein